MIKGCKRREAARSNAARNSAAAHAAGDDRLPWSHANCWARMISFTAAGARMTSPRLGHGDRPRNGEVIPVALPREHRHFFDPATGKRAF